MSAPSLLNFSCGFTLILTTRSPFTPFGTDSPSPLIVYSPVSTPGGISKERCFIPFCFPIPLHLLQGLSIILPWPLQVLHGWTVTNVEKPVLLDDLTWPWPLQTVQVRIDVPGAQPEPLQFSQSTSFLISISSFFPLRTSSNATDVS